MYKQPQHPFLFFILFSTLTFFGCGKEGADPASFNSSSGNDNANNSDSGDQGGGGSKPFAPDQIEKLARWYSMDDLEDVPEEKRIPESKVWKDRAGKFDIQESGSVSGTLRVIKQEPHAGGLRVVQLTDKERLRVSVSKDTNLGENASFTAVFLISRDISRDYKYNTVMHHNDQGSSKRGLYFGWIAEEVFRFSITGPQGNTYVESKVQSMKRPRLEIWTGMQDRESNTERPGLSLSYNGKVVSELSSATGAGDPSPSFQILGSKSNSKYAAVDFSEVIFYEKALSDQERCLVHRYLDQKYILELNITCN